MLLTRKFGLALAGFCLLAASPMIARAQTDITGSNTGGPVAATSGAGTLDTTEGDYFEGKYILDGFRGNDGRGFNTGTFNVHDAVFSGGMGGEAVGAFDSNTPSPNNLPDNVNGGDGGDGLDVGQGSGSTVATIQNGTYTGGVGGTASGSANDTLTGGYGGAGVIVLVGNATVNGGTFQGGNSGSASGSANAYQSAFGGSGLNINNGGNAVINGGTFLGGNGADVTQSQTSSGDTGGAAGNGLIVLASPNSTVDVYGGKFTGGYSGNVFAPDGRTVVSPAAPGSDIAVYGGATTLYGTGFTYTLTQNGVTTTGSGPVTLTTGPNGEQPTGTITGQLQKNSGPSTVSFFIVGGTLRLAAPAAPVNTGPKITVTASASTINSSGQRLITVTTTNTGGAAADMLQITGVTLGGAAPLPAPVSPSPIPTTPNLLSNNAGMNSQVNGFAYLSMPGTSQAVLRVGGQYTNPNTGITTGFAATIRLPLP